MISEKTKKNSSNSIIYFLFLFLFMSMSLYLHAQKSVKVGYIEWTKSSYASGYQLQIKNQKGILIIDKKLSDNHYPIRDLEDGEYQMRVGALSPFSKPVLWTKWRGLAVKTNRKVKVTEVTSNTNPNTVESLQAETSETSKEDSEMANINIPENSPCLTTSIPREVIKKCMKDYIVLDLSTADKRSIYYQHILGGNNRSARIQAVKFYRNLCNEKDSGITSKLRLLFDSSDPRINPEEKEELSKTIKSLESCR